MTGWFVLVAYLAAVNPPRIRPHLAASSDRADPRQLLLGAVTVVAAGLLMVVAADGILDMLDISDETWRLAAGVVCLLVGMRALLVPGLGEMPAADGRGLIPIAFPLLLTPQLASLAILFGATESIATAWGWLVVGVAIGAAAGWLQNRRPALWLALASILAAVLIVVGTALIIAGIRDV